MHYHGSKQHEAVTVYKSKNYWYSVPFLISETNLSQKRRRKTCGLIKPGAKRGPKRRKTRSTFMVGLLASVHSGLPLKTAPKKWEKAKDRMRIGVGRCRGINTNHWSKSILWDRRHWVRVSKPISEHEMGSGSQEGMRVQWANNALIRRNTTDVYR